MAVLEAGVGEAGVDELQSSSANALVASALTPRLDIVRYDTLSKSRRLARYYPPLSRATNAWVLTDGTATGTQPTDASTIARTVYGGHELPADLTDSERIALVNAGLLI